MSRRAKIVVHVPSSRVLRATLSAALLAGSASVCAVATANDGKQATRVTSPYARGAMPAGAKASYADTFGVADMVVKLTESGQLVRFSYRVLDGAKAAPLGDTAATPYLLDEAERVALQIPHMDKVGLLRQKGAQQNGKSYWMVFSNKGNLVKVGHRVSVVIGQFRADGLIVQ